MTGNILVTKKLINALKNFIGKRANYVYGTKNKNFDLICTFSPLKTTAAQIEIAHYVNGGTRVLIGEATVIEYLEDFETAQGDLFQFLKEVVEGKFVEITWRRGTFISRCKSIIGSETDKKVLRLYDMNLPGFLLTFPKKIVKSYSSY